MSRQVVAAAQPVAIRRAKGSTVTFINQDAANDIWLSVDRNQLNSPNWTTVQQGTKLAKGGTVLQYPNFPDILWARSLVDTQDLEVLP